MTPRPLWILLALGLSACGGGHQSPESPATVEGAPPSSPYGQPGYGADQPPPAAAPAPAPPSSLEEPRYAEPPIETLSEAEAELARARAELERAFGTQPADERAESSAGQGRPSKPRAAPPAPDCRSACRALASLQRAALAICRLAGDDSPRCSQAKTLVKSHEQRLASCGCGGEDRD